MKATKVINFFAGPNAGKTTLALELAAYMKRNEYDCEFIGEEAKDRCYDEDKMGLDDQLMMFANQARRQYRLLGTVDYIITDSPLLLAQVYIPGSHERFKRDMVDYSLFMGSFLSLTRDTFNLYNNANFFVRRGNKKYVPHGRKHTEEECLIADEKAKDALFKNNSTYFEIDDLEPVKFWLGTLGWK